MGPTEEEKDGKVASIEELLALVTQARNVQMRLFGFNTYYSLHRWAMIINEEMGKLAKPINDLSKILDGELTPDGDVIYQLQCKIRRQLIEIMACCAATLQEAPALWVVPQQHRHNCRCKLCVRHIRPDQIKGGLYS